MSKNETHDAARFPSQREEDLKEIWRARDRYYYGEPLATLFFFLLFMALCAGLGLLFGGCKAYTDWLTDDVFHADRGVRIRGGGPCTEAAFRAGQCVTATP